MTGTPLDLTPFGPLLKGLGFLYWIAAALCISLAWRRFERRWVKVVASAAIALVFVAPAVRHIRERNAQEDAARARAEAARAHFEMRCREAYEKINRVVPNVQAIVLLKVPPKRDGSKVADPMYPAAARFSEPADDWYIRSWLRWPPAPPASSVAAAGTRPVGYEYVDVLDPRDAVRYRYRLTATPVTSGVRYTSIDLAREVAPGPAPRYGVTYEDLVDPADRAHWIAGDVFRVIDLESNEVVAERKRYLWDYGLGGTEGGRQPWPWAAGYGKRCPDDPGRLDEITPRFVHKALNPTEEK